MKKLYDYQEKAIKETMALLIKNDEPVLLEASVGAGKSLMIAFMLKRFEKINKNALCLVNSAELVRSNSKEFIELGGDPSVFCASLDSKTYTNKILFATPQSIMSALKKNHPVAERIFSLIIIDEAHGVNFKQPNSILIKILRHYKQNYPAMRICGMTGTPFRGQESIVGEHALFKKQTGNISTQYLVERKYLVPPVFSPHEIESFDFSLCKIRKTGEFDQTDLQKVIDSKKRLTWTILQEVQEIMKVRNSAMIFCSTTAHCYEAYDSLPEGSAKIILGNTPDEERNQAFNLARESKLKYLISINCLLTGINIPALNCIVWLRPTTSFLLFVQGIGRGLRLHESKSDCLVLDYAGNLDRFQDIDHPMINEAMAPVDKDDPDYCISCYTCETNNTIYARRCIGITNEKRCDYYFQWVDCPACNGKNDIASKICHLCKYELIDPNSKLRRLSPVEMFTVLNAEYIYLDQTIWIKYFVNDDKIINERFGLHSETSRNISYHKFFKMHLNNASIYFRQMKNPQVMRHMIKTERIKTPYQLICYKDYKSEYRIQNKIFC